MIKCLNRPSKLNPMRYVISRCFFKKQITLDIIICSLIGLHEGHVLVVFNTFQLLRSSHEWCRCTSLGESEKYQLVPN